MSGTEDGANSGLGDTGAATSDLFFGLAGVLIVLICLMSGPVRQAVGTQLSVDAISVPGEWVAVAEGAAVVLTRPGAAPMRLSLDEITAEGLATWAEGAAVPLVVLTQESVDSAFLLDSALAAAGLDEVRRIRLDGTCARPQLLPQGFVCNG
jgi:hypothetical protein